MKRLLLLFVVLAFIAAGVFLSLRSRANAESAHFLPADCALFVALPDMKTTKDRWPKTALAQIQAEPSVAEFLKKPLELMAGGGLDEARALLDRVKPGRLFLGVTSLRENGADVLLGFEYSGGRKELDAAMERLYRELEKAEPASKRSTADYQGDSVTSVIGAKPIFFSASHGTWGFFSNSEAALKQALDRTAGRDKSPSLADDEAFKTVNGHLPKSPDFLWFGRFKPVIDLLLAIGEKQQPGGVNAKQLKQLEKIKALGGTLLLDGADQKETTFILYPEGPTLPAVDGAPMALTTPATTFYYDATSDWKTLASEDYWQSLPPEAQTLLTGAGVDLKQLPEIFGSDLGVIVNWPSEAMIPSVLTVVEVKDRKRAEALVEGLFTKFALKTTGSELHGARVFGFPAMGIQLIDPAVAVGDKFLYASLTGPELERALSVQPGAPTLETAAAFKPALAVSKAGVQAFGYLECKTLFQGIYNRLRPIAMFAAAMSPDVSKVVDVSKLPETEAISRHLSPIIYTNKQVTGGWLVESAGPVTLSQAFFVGVFGATAAYMSQVKANQR